jgi:hypothetical protein
MGESSGDAKKELLELDDPTEDFDAPDMETAESGMVPRPTVRPDFDPVAYARKHGMRERMSTITDENALEQARLASMQSNLPPPRPRFESVEIDAGEEDLDALPTDEQIAIFHARLSPLSRTPTLAREMSKLGSLVEDPKTAYVLGFVDGLLPLETIVEVTGLPELDTLRVLDRMITQGVIVFPSTS